MYIEIYIYLSLYTHTYICMYMWGFFPQSASKPEFGVTLPVTEKMPRESKSVKDVVLDTER